MIDEMGMVALIMALAQIIKKAELLPTRYIPTFNLLLGILAGIYLVGSINFDAIILGLMMGAASCGVFDFAKKALIEEEDESL